MTATATSHRMNGPALHPGSAPTATSRPAPVLDLVVPVYNEERDLGEPVRRLHGYLTSRVPLPDPDHDRRQRQHGRDAGIAHDLAASSPTVEVLHLPQKGRGRALRAVWSVDGTGARLHGRRPVHRPRGAAAARRAAGDRSLRSRHRHPAGRGLPGRARTEAGVHLALLQPHPARLAAGAVLRCPMWFQGDPERCRRSNCCRWSRTTAGSSTPSCWCWPSGPGCGSTRCRSTGSTTRTAGSTSPHRQGGPARRRAGRPGVGRRRPAAGRDPRAARPRAAGPTPGVPKGMTGQPCGSRRSAWSPRWPTSCCSRCCVRWCRPAAPTSSRCALTAVANTAANRRLTFGVRGREGAARQQLQGLVDVRARAGD